jgi:xeroderma pigmentosum group C-complementing protein
MLNGISKELICVYFVSLLRAVQPQLDARLVISLTTFPRTLKAAKKLDENKFPLEYCVDILIDNERICIDPTSGEIKESVKWKDPIYVIAIANSHYPPFFTIKDITRKFVERWSTVKSKRSEVFWQQCLWLFSSDKDIGKSTAEDEENKDLIALEANEKLPTSLSGFKNHPLFALERHLNANQAIYPKEKLHSVGVFKDELVFPRKLVHTLYSAENWKRKGRMIPQLASPYKAVVSKGKKESVKQLYGEWQTVDWERPSLLDDGSIPTNEYGNIEIFHDLMIPLKCAHILGDDACKAAQSLGIEFAKACVDFEHGRGRSFPLFNGIVVHEEDLDSVLTAVKSNLEIGREKERVRKQTEIFQRWKKIIMGALLRERLRKDYA